MPAAEISLADEPQLITLSQACRPLPSKPAPSTLWRWRTKGVSIHGTKIKLRCVRVGGQWFTTAAFFTEFLRAQTEAALGPLNESTERTEATERRLAAAGLK